MLTQFCIEKLNALPKTHVLGSLANTKILLKMGYFVSPFLATKKVVDAVKVITGGNVNHIPFYPNFDHDVLRQPIEYLLDQILHYSTHARPEQVKVYREELKVENFTVLESADPTEAYHNMLNSKDNLSAKDKTYVVELFDILFQSSKANITNKQTLALVAGQDQSVLKTATDMLRFVTTQNGGNPDLTEQVRFKKLPDPKVLERIINEEDIRRHKAVWKILFKLMHVGARKTSYPKTYAIAYKLRNNIALSSFASRVDASTPIHTKALLLQERPTEFSRRILSLGKDYLPFFLKVIPRVPVKNLIQLWGACKAVVHNVPFRNVQLPSGKSVVLARSSTSMITALSLISRIKQVISTTTETVSIDPILFKCPLPTGQSSATDNVVARGTRLPITGDFLRFFVYWKGIDIDLSADFYDAAFNSSGRLYYGNAHSTNSPVSYHSGDIVTAPNGASEFIDIKLDSQKDRYIAMDVRIYTGHESFAEMDEVFAGFMQRNNLKSGEVFEPSTVKFKFDLNGKGKVTVPLIIDTIAKEVIWCDGVRAGKLHTNIAMQAPNFVEQAVRMCEYKVTIGELLELRGNPDTAYSADYCMDINDINANLI